MSKPSTARLAGTEGWSVHVGVPVAELNAPVSRSLQLLVAGTAASVGSLSRLDWVIAREIAQRRRMEALESAAALLDSEKRGALAIDAAELGTWRWDLTANEFSGCNRFGALLGLPGARSGETRWSADRIFALLEPPHRAALASFGGAGLESGKSGKRGISGSIRRSRRVLAACGRKGGRSAQPASCDSRRAGRHRYPQARGDRSVLICFVGWLRPRKRSSAGFRANCTIRSARR